MSSRTPPGGFQVVAISPNMPGSSAAGMNGEFTRMTIMSANDATKQSPPSDPSSLAFVKGGKRKRLSKVCCLIFPPAVSVRRPDWELTRPATLAIKANGGAMVQVRLYVAVTSYSRLTVTRDLAPCSNW